ncbi:Cys-tRNA(Pro) deacylase [Paludicola sp. MB14-C6]|uniref:Cys-tRNA(Pro) deacylase n=1 Tax=Paludihabitans sp. MB14-C6 TaxID=3070656 RepID=UPI0027DAE732|nr:Cys-tRNA(Pro) deacylase [Paludicola sp. MB14-C6]WMJ23908.1 Cys-tRNA(Pro) deacylase [Paludicola sp. MB14-C6]
MATSKTNAMRILDKAKISYQSHIYDHSDGHIDGVAVAQKLGQPFDQVYKTLVTIGASKIYYVFVIPVACELHLKHAAKAVNEKSIEMIKVADINKVTGYIRGGCSPIGMKKNYQTVVDESCLQLQTMMISAGKIGQQVELSPKDLLQLVNGMTANIVINEKEAE